MLDRDTLTFGQEFGSGTFIGTSPLESVQLTNSGDAQLVITSAKLTADPQFKFTPPSKTTLAPSESTYLEAIFSPTAIGTYRGSILIVSNAENAPMKSIALSGCGIGPDGGRPDGGCG